MEDEHEISGFVSSQDSLGNELSEIFNGASDEEDESAAAVASIVAAGSSAMSSLPALSTEDVRKGRLPGSKTIQRRQCTWFEDYLSDSPRYPAYKFREVFRLPIKLYNAIYTKLSQDHPVLLQRVDGRGKPGHTTHQKLLASLRRLGQPSSYRERDETSCMSPESQRFYFRAFVRGVEKSYGPRYLNRDPTVQELRRITAEYEEKGFPGCRGSVDCMHLLWKQCPLAWKGQFHNRKNGKLATISCEAVVDHTLYCWHWFSGRAGTNNDLTVLEFSPFFNGLLLGERTLKLPEGFYVSDKHVDWPLYFLTDGIYGDWAIFQKPISSPRDEKEAYLTERQESTRKEVERFNDCIQGRFKILRYESFEFDADFIVSISNCCVILHNMLVELRMAGELDDEYDSEGRRIRDEDILTEFMEAANSTGQAGPDLPHPSTVQTMPTTLDGIVSSYMSVYDIVTDRDIHRELTEALAQHQWNHRQGRSL